MRHSAPIAALLAACLACAPALAASDDAVSVAVSTRGLDLSNPRDAGLLDARIARAATRACAAPGLSGASAYGAYVACRADALAAARANAGRVIASAETRGGGIQSARR